MYRGVSVLLALLLAGCAGGFDLGLPEGVAGRAGRGSDGPRTITIIINGEQVQEAPQVEVK